MQFNFTSAMDSSLMSVRQVVELILSNRTLLLAGDEQVLDQLPNGSWIAGTIPYFMSPEGGRMSKELIHVVDLTDQCLDFKTTTYDEHTIGQVVADEFENGFTVLILPPLQPVWKEFALSSPDYENLYLNPLVGWVAGVEYGDFGKVTPKTYHGSKKSEHLGVAIHAKLPDHLVARVEIINLYRPGAGDVITFSEKGFESKACIVNGQMQNLYDYFISIQADERLPLVADYAGAHINVGSVWDRESSTANLFAPVFPNVKYRIAKSQNIDYQKEFEQRLRLVEPHDITFACNCLMNYFTFGLEGKKLKGISGPITFGEIAFHLLNQTFVYMVIENVSD